MEEEALNAIHTQLLETNQLLALIAHELAAAFPEADAVYQEAMLTTAEQALSQP
jgi:hypothetical protein